MSPTRDQILQTTVSLLEKQGCHATGLNEIIRESSTPKGSLYYYFPEGKEQLVSEAILQAGQAMADRIRSHLADETPLTQAIHDLILRIADNVEASGFVVGSPLTAVAMETATTSPRINAACRAAFDLLIAAFEDKLLASGLETERASDLAQFITAAIEGGVILSRTMHSVEPLRVVARQLSTALAC